MALYEFMAQFISDRKKLKFQKVIAERTRYLTVVLEDIYQPQNASAVLRTCDCLGIQDVHVIENRNEFNPSKDVALGSAKWLSIKKYNQFAENTRDAFAQLKQKGYRIVATSPHKNDQNLDEIVIGGKMALVFGTEMNGLSQIALEQADEFVKIPMYGFTESFNISVSAAILLSNLTSRIRKSEIQWQLTEEEKTDVMLNWAKRIVKHPGFLENEFNKKYNK